MKKQFAQPACTRSFFFSGNTALIALLAFPVLLFSCKKIHDHLPGNRPNAEVIYVETNDFANNNNAVLAYVNTGDGMLQPLPGSPFFTNGEGVGNPTQALGPEDSDTQLKLSPDGKFLLAVNPGTNTIAVFQVNVDGTLTPVEGSPFPSGGQTPSSIDIKGKYVYVVNKSDDYAHTITQAPNYTVFTLESNGVLTPVAASTVSTTAGTSPAQTLVSNDGRFLFGVDFLGFMLMPPVGTLRSFTINGGTIAPVAGTPYSLPTAYGGALGLWQHPKDNVLYVGFPVAAKVGVYVIGNDGSLMLHSTVDGGAAACWIRTNRKGNRMYVLNSAENTVGIYDLSNALAPVLLTKFPLKNSGPGYLSPDGSATFTTSQDFSLSFSPDEKFLYVVSQYTNPVFNLGDYNFLHALQVNKEGMLSEETEPVALPVPSTLRPQGIAVKQVKLPEATGTKG